MWMNSAVFVQKPKNGGRPAADAADETKTMLLTQDAVTSVDIPEMLEVLSVAFIV